MKQDNRKMRGIQIAKNLKAIQRLDECHYTVKSQSNEKTYDIVSTENGWSCKCPDHIFRKVCCKHIHAVEISIMMHQKIRDDIVISEIPLDSCKHCNSENIVKMGIQHNKQHDIQMFKCKDYKRKFSINLGFVLFSPSMKVCSSYFYTL